MAATTKTSNRTYLTVKIAANGYAVLALGLSFIHIVALFQGLGSTWQAWIAPVLVDGFVVIGKIGTGPAFTPATRKVARTVTVAAGTVSLAANILAGDNTGDRIIGATAVIGYWTAEYLLAHTKATTTKAPAAKTTPAVNKDGKTAEQVRANAARTAKAAATRKANAEAKAARAAEQAAAALAEDTRAYI
jgi:hypothetical protein